MKLDKVLFINENQIGDMLLSTPVIKAFHEHYPKSFIGYFVSSDVAPLLKGLPFIDEIVVYDKGDNIVPVIKRIHKYDIAVLMDFKYRSAWIPFLAGIPVRAGLQHKRGFYLTNKVQRDMYEVMHYEPINYRNIVERSTGIKIPMEESEIKPYIAPASKEVIKTVDKIFEKIDKDKIIVGVAPKTGVPEKNWEPEKLCELMKEIDQNYNVQFLILGTWKDYYPEYFSCNGMIDLRDQTSLEEMSEIMRRLDYFIGFCSAPIHMAAAWDIPCVAIYSSTSPLQWAPRKRCIVVQHLLPCSPCNVWGAACLKEDNPYLCCKLITVDEVFSAFKRLVQEYPAKINF